MHLSVQIEDHFRLIRPMLEHSVTRNFSRFVKTYITNIMSYGFTFPH